ncbi:hypothetical protein V6N11_022610 [Hibiscus sabdariffa]|uniref:MADS-box domain-containing protein n=1 Tax=Hibiscus sabdariffa TaxID=183260 RepID=A0ABR2TJQ4_9ROSI
MASSWKRKMDDETRIQGALSKRRACLLRKASEISVNCNADIALAAFSPCGRFCKFYTREKMRHVLERYIQLLPEKRHQKYEMENEESASLSQVSCCQKNLQHSLQEIRERKHWSSNSSPINRIFAIPGMVMVYETGYINLEEFHQVLLVHPAALLTYSFIQNLQNRVHTNSSMQQRIMGNPDMPFLPYQQPLRALGTSNLNQSSMGNDNMTSNVHFQHQQQGVLGITSLGQHANNESSECQSNMTSNVQFQPQLQGLLLLGGTLVGHHVKNVPFRGQQNQTPPSYDNHKRYPQNGASPQTSQLQVNPYPMNLLCSPNYNTIQNFDVTPLLDFESPIYNTVQSLDPTRLLNSESPNCNTLQNLDVTPPLDPESPNCNTLENFDVASFFNFESPDYNTLHNLDITPTSISESPNYNTLQDLDVTPTSNSESSNYNIVDNLDVTPPLTSESYSTLQNLDVTPTSNSESPNYNTVQNLDVTPFSNSESISSESFFSLPIHGDDNNVDNGNTDNNSTSINNTIGNNDTNEEENPQPESPCSMFISNLLSISSKAFFSIPSMKMITM